MCENISDAVWRATKHMYVCAHMHAISNKKSSMHAYTFQSVNIYDDENEAISSWKHILTVDAKYMCYLPLLVVTIVILLLSWTFATLIYSALYYSWSGMWVFASNIIHDVTLALSANGICLLWLNIYFYILQIWQRQNGPPSARSTRNSIHS